MSPTEPLHRLPAPPPRRRNTSTAAVRNVVRSWHGRTLRVQVDNELLKAYRALLPYQSALATHSPHAPRLLGNLTVELTKRGLLPC